MPLSQMLNATEDGVFEVLLNRHRLAHNKYIQAIGRGSEKTC